MGTVSHLPRPAVQTGQLWLDSEVAGGALQQAVVVVGIDESDVRPMVRLRRVVTGADDRVWIGWFAYGRFTFAGQEDRTRLALWAEQAAAPAAPPPPRAARVDRPLTPLEQRLFARIFEVQR